MKKLKITHINTLVDAGGAAKSTMRLAAAQRAMGHDVHILTGGAAESCEYAHSFDLSPMQGLVQRCKERGELYYEYQGSHKLVSNEIIQSSDIVHCSNLHGDYFNPWSLSALSHIKPVVWTLRDMQSLTGHCAHSFDCEKWQTGCGNCQRLDTYPELATDNTAGLISDKKYIYENSFLQLVTPAYWLQKKIKKSILQMQPVELIYNCCDTNTFKPYPKAQIRQKLGIPQDAFVIGVVAHGGVLMNVWKGGKYTQIVWESLKKSIPGSVFLNIGDGGKADDASILNVKPVQDEALLAQIYNAFDVFLYTSVADTCPLVVIEALSCGVPIVTFDTGGVPELVRNKTDGFVFRQGDTDALICAVKALYDNRKIGMLMGQNARAGAVERFSVENTAGRYIDLYYRWIEQHKTLARNIKYFDMSRVPEIIKTPDFLNAEKSKGGAACTQGSLPVSVARQKYPKITVVTPSFNQANYLESCIRSVLEQGYPNLEYIVIDGGSTDGSADIIRKYQSQLTYWVSEPDKGQYHAIMKGFARSTGEIMGWINSDDMLHPKGLWRLADLFNRNPDVEFLTGRRIGFQADGSLKVYNPDLIRWNRQRLLDKKTMHQDGLFVMQEGTYWRRSLWEKAGSSLDLSLALAGDFELWLRFSRYAKLYTANTIIGGFRGYSAGQRCQQFRDKYIAECDNAIDRESLMQSVFSDSAPPPVISYRAYNQAADDSVSKSAKSCDVSIVLCTMNRAELLDKMLASIPAAAAGINYEIIAVVGQCSDNTLEILKKHNITEIYDERECLGDGKHPWPMLYNFAFSKANGKWAMFASDDIVFGENCFANAVGVLNPQPDNVAGGIFFYKNLHERPRPNPLDDNKFFVGMGYEFNILMNYGLMRLDCFRQIDGFDEVYNFYYADSDLCNKLYSIGKIMLPLPMSLVAHNDIFDNLKKSNVEKLQHDVNLYRGKWCKYYVDENNRPNRLLWQRELTADYIPQITGQTTLTAVNSYWRGISFFQRNMYQQAKEQFVEAINNGLSDPKVRDYLNKCDGEKNKNKNICSIIFSKDRALQLDAAIRSFGRCCTDRIKLYVLYKASNQLHKSQYEKLKTRFNDVIFIEQGDFRNDVLRLLNGSEYVLFAVDDNIFVSDFSIEKIADVLDRQNDCLGFSLRLGKNTTYCYSKNARQSLPSFEQLENNILKFDWTKSQLDFNYPLEVSSSIYRVGDILPLIEQLRFDNPNSFEGLMALNTRIFANAKRNLLCFDKSAAFCNPLNMVQAASANRASERKDYNPLALAELFEKGMAIDTDRYFGFVPNACHQEVELYFKNSGCLSKTPAVSVEMVAYNAEKYIAQAIESVLRQSFTDFELLVVDDGSDDKTEQIVKSFSDERIRYIRQDHKGLAAGRNLAVNSAVGKYIVCVDSDDFITPDYLRSIVEYAEKNPGFDYYYPAKLTLVDGNSGLIGSDWDYNNFTDSRILPAVLFANGFSPIPIVGSLIRKAMFERIGLYEDCGIFEDFVFLCKNAMKMKFNRFEASPAYFYRRLPQSTSQKFEIRDKTISHTLNQMISMYPPEVICPQLLNVSDPYTAKLQYYKYVSDIFYRHADGFHFVKYGQYFRRFGDFYKEKFLALQNHARLQPQSLAGGV